VLPCRNRQTVRPRHIPQRVLRLLSTSLLLSYYGEQIRELHASMSRKHKEEAVEKKPKAGRPKKKVVDDGEI